MPFSEQSLATQLVGLLPAGSGAGRLLIAFSGGLDSCVLLHAMQRLRNHFPESEIVAIHVNHGLSHNADVWQAFCENTCAQLGISLHVERVQIERGSGASLENVARERRYSVFSDYLQAGDSLLMAHHLDDQSETFLLRTLRGAGPRGLSAMPARRVLGKGVLIRPLLMFGREELEDWARKQQLEWIDDESNASTVFDRNYVRHEVLPRIAERWPGYRESWMRSAQLCTEADALLEELAAQDYTHVRSPDPTVISCTGMAGLSEVRQRNLLRYWLGIVGISEPGWNILTRMVSEVLAASVDAQPQLSWQTGRGAVVVRRHASMLYLQQEWPVLESRGDFSWNPPEVLQLVDNGSVHIEPCRHGLRIGDGQRFVLRYRRGGEECRLAGRRMRPLKKILHDSGMAPWLRERLPLVYVDDVLVCIPGVGVCEGWQAHADEPAWQVIWTPPGLQPVIE
ncbi:MAG: tRNA lysidine(34) synthetase TilS [Gammaproteobacteria bacterium]|nr:tRNA lysidine(34) synthetase TilS [Gammaproteobacteria bacterium]MDP2349290.1 tRNA lysidine(34) synthetase TilS [Gammaproteobacteria bacterium]